MAMVNFKKGLLADLPATKAEGTFYVTTDERALYLDIDGSTRVRIGDFQEFATLAALQANTNPSTTALYYIADVNCLAKWNGSAYIQINLDTGATSVEVVGDGNAVTAASYDAATHKLTLTMGESFVKTSEVGDLAAKDKVAKADLDTALANELDGKVASVTAADGTVDVGTDAVNPALKVKVHAAGEGESANMLQAKDDGLYVPTPASAAEYSIVKDENSGDFAAVYHLTRAGMNTGAAINIPKDMVVQSGSVVEVTDAQKGTDGFPAEAGTYIKLVLQNVADPLYINVGDLIEYVTSGSAEGDMVIITVSDDHKVTATITDGTITLAKLATAVQTEIGKAHEHANKALLDTYTQTEENLADAVSKKHEHANATELAKIADGDKNKWDSAATKADTAVQEVATGSANGNISVDGTDVAVKGLSEGAFMAKSTAIPATGAVDTKLATEKAVADAVTIAMTWGSF